MSTLLNEETGSNSSNDENGISCCSTIVFQFGEEGRRQSNEPSLKSSSNTEDNYDCANVETTGAIWIHFAQDPTKDMFQIGRATHSNNDFVVSGQMHEDEEGVPTGPVSRHSCRIVCDRLPPFQSRIYAGGFDDNKVTFFCHKTIIYDDELKRIFTAPHHQ